MISFGRRGSEDEEDDQIIIQVTHEKVKVKNHRAQEIVLVDTLQHQI